MGRFFGAVERLKRAAEEQNNKEAQKAFAAMSVAYDRYLKAGNLYETYDAITSTEGFYAGISNSNLKFVPPSKDPPKIKDNVSENFCRTTGPNQGCVRHERSQGDEVKKRTRRLSSVVKSKQAQQAKA